MDGISFLYDISQMSFGFILMNIVYMVILGRYIESPYFVWIIASAYIIEFVRKRDNSKALVSSLIMLIPCYFIKSSDEIIAFILLCVCEVIIIFTDEVNKNYVTLRGKIATENIIVIGSSVIAILFNTNYAVNILPLFIIMYILSSVILLRNLRMGEFNVKNKKHNKLTFIYSLSAILFCMLISINVIKNFVLNLLLKVYIALVNVFLIGVKYVGYFIGFSSEKIGKVKLKGMDQSNIDTSQGQKIANQFHSNTNYVTGNKYVLIFADIILIAAAFLLLIFILKKFSAHKKHKEDYVEEREFIKSDVSLTKNLFDKIKKVGAPKDYAEYIRYYYKKFMYKSIKKDVNITDHDTTLQINEKSEKYFNKSLLKDIREIYIKVRYGNEKPSKETKESFYNYYKGL